MKKSLLPLLNKTAANVVNTNEYFPSQPQQQQVQTEAHDDEDEDQEEEVEGKGHRTNNYILDLPRHQWSPWYPSP